MVLAQSSRVVNQLRARMKSSNEFAASAPLWAA
jgi:hypothetical protein